MKAVTRKFNGKLILFLLALAGITLAASACYGPPPSDRPAGPPPAAQAQ